VILAEQGVQKLWTTIAANQDNEKQLLAALLIAF
jgi:hypothetical protein